MPAQLKAYVAHIPLVNLKPDDPTKLLTGHVKSELGTQALSRIKFLLGGIYQCAIGLIPESEDS